MVATSTVILRRQTYLSTKLDRAGSIDFTNIVRRTRGPKVLVFYLINNAVRKGISEDEFCVGEREMAIDRDDEERQGLCDLVTECRSKF